jgi:polyferredoxin
VQWWLTGSTITPIEPSEAIEFGRSGIINAGLIFFALALLSTLILGRWFCGWGCHLVMLQDLCGWIMKMCGVRPRPFRSRLLISVPLLLALYMFIWPAFYRLAIAPWMRPDLTWPGFSAHFTTDDFWRTFPGVGLAIPFLLVCGFATVYFLGVKGFCTYGCPYGGFFAPLDRFAVGRIRVTDDCEQCGHCTATCTSNVRVHEEVREFGMVVDPGCMKCLDCVSVCPKNALYFGFGRPAAKAGPAKHAAPERTYDLTLREEIAFALVFAAAFFAMRGDVVRFPLLMSAGAAGVLTFVVWKAWRVVRDGDVRLHGFQLRRDGAWRLAGYAFIALAMAAALLAAHAGALNLAHLNAARLDGRVTVGLDDVYGPTAFEAPAEQRDAAGRAIAWYRRASGVGDGGWGWRTTGVTHVRLAWLSSVRGDHQAALARQHGPDPGEARARCRGGGAQAAGAR